MKRADPLFLREQQAILEARHGKHPYINLVRQKRYVCTADVCLRQSGRRITGEHKCSDCIYARSKYP